MHSVKLPKHKSVYILPNLFTTASLFSGFLGLLWASGGHFESCAIAIFFSALMDALDGKVARLTGTSSEFGIQFDSLSDLVAFGVTPGFLIFHAYLQVYDRLGIAAAFLFTVCAALRLARFNVQTATANKRFFTGLPAPAAGCSLAGVVLIAPFLPEFLQGGLTGALALMLTVGIAFLMVSTIRYASFKELGAFKARPFRNMVVAILLFALGVAYPRIFGFIFLFGYILSGLIYTFLILPRRSPAVGRGFMHQQPDKESAPDLNRG
jgi:CDP-diacylglycerol--serine O-phosphatidyltransferase